MNKRFEVPYNFSKRLIRFYAKNASFIRYVYVAPYKEDSLHTRSTIETSSRGHCYMPGTRAEYESHLRCLADAKLSFVILWQVPDKVLSPEVIKYYQELGASGFIVGSDENAHRVKMYDPNLVVICSLVQRVCYDILQKDLSPYDYIILYYPYNRALDALRELHSIKDKLILMPNTFCHVDCPSMHHWFPAPDKPFVQNRDCPAMRYISMTAFIAPEHLYLFDDWVGGYKLQGREYVTDLVEEICRIYFSRDDSRNLCHTMLGDDLSYKFRRMSFESDSSIYYNMKSYDLIRHLRP